MSLCQICGQETGHQPDCPVKTGHPQRGWQQMSQQDMQAFGQQAQGQLAQMGNVAIACPHCGGLNGSHQAWCQFSVQSHVLVTQAPCPWCGVIGSHQWAGQGDCPGVGKEPATLSNRIEALQAENARLRALLIEVVKIFKEVK